MYNSLPVHHSQRFLESMLFYTLFSGFNKAPCTCAPYNCMGILQTGRPLFFLREYFFPSGCVLCGLSLTGVNEAWYGLCEQCREKINPEPGERCLLCGRPMISEHDRCLSCRNGPERSYDNVKVFFPYYGKYRRLLSAYKFSKNLALGNFFVQKISDFLAENSEEYENAVIVPVPPRPGKIKEKGWDQVEFLARLLEKGNASHSIKIYRCLKRLRSGVQKKLDREDRMKNLKGRIVLIKTAPKIALLIDDVMTTGATMDVCAAALKKGGTEKVYGLCLFYD